MGGQRLNSKAQKATFSLQVDGWEIDKKWQRKFGVGDKVKGGRRNLSRRNGRFFSKSAKKVKRMVGVMGVGVMGDFQKKSMSESFQNKL